MKPLSPHAQLLLTRYKTAQSLASGEKTLLLDTIQERALRGDVPLLELQQAPSVVAHESLAQTIWASPLAKIVVGLALLGGPAAGVLAWRSDSRAPPSAAAADRMPHAPRDQLPVTPAPKPRELPQAAARAEAVPEAAGAARPRPQRAAASEPTIDEEVRLLNAAQAALRSSDAQGSLRLLEEHARRFPNGKLSRAREVTHMLALCQSGRGERARAEAERFLAQHPASPFADRVKKICATPSSKP